MRGKKPNCAQREKHVNKKNHVFIVVKIFERRPTTSRQRVYHQMHILQYPVTIRFISFHTKDEHYAIAHLWRYIQSSRIFSYL